MLLSDLIRLLQSDLSAMHRLRTARAYATTYKSVLSFSRHDPALGEVFTPSWLWDYQCYLVGRGLKRNTISFYMRMLRSMYNKAVELGVFVNVPRLFLKTFTGLDPTIKRSVSPELIFRIARARLSGTLDFCRDMFILCFYLQGMTFIDFAYLRKSDIQGDYIVYRRRKTNSLITVSIREKAKKIIDKYAALMKDSPYVFPVIVDPAKDDAVQYQSALRSQNRRLKKLAAELGLNVTLTTYVARHSWATMAYHNKVPTALISEAMGHKTEEVTRIYLASFGLERLSEANDIVIKALERGSVDEERGIKENCPSLLE